eukprot:TRINITY_DN3029_c0_g1_i1.p1 TRINITY_DN3029_c0_g1~~TRINITY_DN3029_c0_g1_i1.p1  ORF type:complete len:145 (-),score=32.28 TRINITY_DN3029_c0_g1_i1:229-663(-)
MTRVYYKGAMAAIIVFDITNIQSFEAIKKWKNDVDKKLQLSSGEAVPVLLLANKTDLSNDALTKEQIESFSEEFNFLNWCTTSAKLNFNINDSILFLVDYLIRLQEGGIEALQEYSSTDSFRLLPHVPKQDHPLHEEPNNGCSC